MEGERDKLYPPQPHPNRHKGSVCLHKTSHTPDIGRGTGGYKPYHSEAPPKFFNGGDSAWTPVLNNDCILWADTVACVPCATGMRNSPYRLCPGWHRQHHMRASGPLIKGKDKKVCRSRACSCYVYVLCATSSCIAWRKPYGSSLHSRQCT